MSSEQLPVAISVEVQDCTTQYCVIGAGPSGLTVLKNLSQAGIPCQGFEAVPELGGNWNFSSPAGRVYETTHLISSKGLTQFTDFPMPAEFPEFPSHGQVLEYLQSYATHFELASLIQFSTQVEQLEPDQDTWLVQLSDGTKRRYRGVVIANGHHRTPHWPELPGSFTGEILHSSQYKSPRQLAGRRVLVIGAGNSGCDIAVDAALHASSASLSMRRGYHFIPKFIRGYPCDQWGEWLLRWRIPLWLRRAILAYATRVTLGSPLQVGLPTPDHRFLETHPLINSQLFYHLGHGRISIKPPVQLLDQRWVIFADDTSEEYDLLIVATGYDLDFPFVDRQVINWQAGCPQLYLHAFHPTRSNLFVAGMIQPDSGQWGLTDLQAQVMAILIQHADSSAVQRWFAAEKTGPQPDLGNGITYLRTVRHQLEVEHYSYRRRLKKMLQQLKNEIVHANR